MRTFVRHLVPVVIAALASMAAVAIATPTPEAPLAQPCDAGQWWDPTGKVCRPLGVGPQPLACDNGSWWDPSANVCRPPLVSPAG